MALVLFVLVVVMALGGVGVFLAIDRSSTSASITTAVDVFTDAYLATTRTNLNPTSSTTTSILTTAITAPAMLFLSTYSSRNEF